MSQLLGTDDWAAKTFSFWRKNKQPILSLSNKWSANCLHHTVCLLRDSGSNSVQSIDLEEHNSQVLKDVSLEYLSIIAFDQPFSHTGLSLKTQKCSFRETLISATFIHEVNLTFYDCVICHSFLLSNHRAGKGQGTNKLLRVSIYFLTLSVAKIRKAQWVQKTNKINKSQLLLWTIKGKLSLSCSYGPQYCFVQIHQKELWESFWEK